jgi:hypothetical protein
MPLFKVPIQLSYLLYLSALAPALAMGYFKIAMGLCQLTGTQPSILLHPLDFLDGKDVPELSFFPAMRLASSKKLALVDRVLSMLTDTFTVVTVAQHAKEVRLLPDLPVREPRFRASTTDYI